MNIYVETNFVLELVLNQEQSDSCDKILSVCETEKHQLVIPAFSLAEPHETLIRLERNRKELQRKLKIEIEQIIRNILYKERLYELKKISDFLSNSIDEDKQRFINYRNRLLKLANVISLTTEILKDSATYEYQYNLSPQDAIVYASVISHLQDNKPKINCFLNRNSKDFDDPSIRKDLQELNCLMIPKFDDGLNYIQSQ